MQNVEMRRMEISNSRSNSIKNVVACLNCNKNHKKCDGGRPCFLCVRNNIECVENHKRKPIGRPKKSEEEKNLLKKMKKENMEEMDKNFHENKIKCTNCNELQNIFAKFCSQCGSKIDIETSVTKENEILKKQIEMLKKKNENYIKIIQSATMCYYQYWVLTKVMFNLEGDIYSPVPSVILETSGSFKNLLGYAKLADAYFPDLMPRNHHQLFNFKNTLIKVERVKGMLEPKICFEEEMFLRHSSGHYIHLVVTSNVYLDGYGLPAFRISFVKNIICLNISPNIIPNCKLPSFFTLYCDEQHEIPSFVERLGMKVI